MRTIFIRKDETKPPGVTVQGTEKNIFVQICDGTVLQSQPPGLGGVDGLVLKGGL